MGRVVHFKPKQNNKLYRYIGILLAYVRQRKEEAATRYLKSLPNQLQHQVALTVDTITRKRNATNKGTK